MRVRHTLVLALAPALACATDGTLTKPHDTGAAAADTAPDTGIDDSAETATETGGETGDETGADTGPEPDPNTLDQDGDGFTPNEGDCDDERAHVHPGAPDYCDGLDADCDGESIPDGSCSEVGDPRLMWSWSFEGFRDDYGYVQDAVGDVDGDGREDASVQGGGGAVDGSAGVLFGADLELWPARGPTIGLVWSDNWPEWGLQDITVGGDVNADGHDDVWVSTGGDVGRTRGMFLFLGREGVFDDHMDTIDDVADAAWVDGGDLELRGPSGAGELNGDNRTDLLAFAWTDGGRETRWAIIPGEDDPAGTHLVADLLSFNVDYVGNELTGFGAIVPDLDGDGFDEVMVTTQRKQDDDSVVTFLEGEDLTDGGTLADAGTDAWLDQPGETVAELATRGLSADDVDGDGLNDLLLWTGDEASWSTNQCAALFSGGVPNGEFSALNTVTVCEAAFGWGGWQADVDGDGAREIQVIADRGWIPLLSSQLREGGVQSDADFRGPATYWGAYFVTTADFNGDGLPEWVYYEPEWDDPELDDEFGRTLILTGFEIPWDDPTKW